MPMFLEAVLVRQRAAIATAQMPVAFLASAAKRNALASTSHPEEAENVSSS